LLGNEAFTPEKVTKDHELLSRVKYSSEGQTGCILLPTNMCAWI